MSKHCANHYDRPAEARYFAEDTSTGRFITREDLCGQCARWRRQHMGSWKFAGTPVEERVETHAALRDAYGRAVASGDERAIARAERNGYGL